MSVEAEVDKATIRCASIFTSYTLPNAKTPPAFRLTALQSPAKGYGDWILREADLGGRLATTHCAADSAKTEDHERPSCGFRHRATYGCVER